ncbi:hypothetical protein C8T65DRAFT_85602 [Cerioporus squamosus]|nr:hypothetical protein C8T65DRAFT_85602 [Cerioporus squamosus]
MSAAPPITDLIAAVVSLEASFPRQLLLDRRKFWLAGMIFRLLVGETASGCSPLKRGIRLKFRHLGASSESAGPAPHPMPATDDIDLDVAGTLGGSFQVTFAQDLEGQISRGAGAAFEAKRAELREKEIVARAPRRRRVPEGRSGSLSGRK